MASADPTRNAIALQILRRRRETLERVAHEKQEQLLPLTEDFSMLKTVDQFLI